MGKRLQDTEIAQFTRDGFVFPVRAYSSEHMAIRQNWLEEIEANLAGRIPPALNAKIHLLVPWLWDMVHDACIVDAVEDLIGPNLACWGTSFITKAGPGTRFVTWHQDATHWSLTEPRAVTAWVAFTASRRENGCVRMIPRSNHRALPHEDSGDALNMLGRRERVVEDVDETNAVDIILAPGEMSLHHPLVVHGSEPNRSSIRRVGFAIRYIPAGIGQRNGQRNSVTVVRGDGFGHFEHEAAPEGLFHPDALVRHKRALRLGMEVIFRSGSNTASR
jgi:non-haem Fe2+, alpha-ketoglutarate-dependent halogenase